MSHTRTFLTVHKDDKSSRSKILPSNLHRLSTVRPADMIVLMERGAVMEVGSHDELMQQQGWYYALYQS